MARFLTDMIGRMAAHIASEIRKRDACTRLDAATWQTRMARRNKRRRPPEAGALIPAIPPRGPPPLAGGAEAPLDFSDR
ncbi:hypothetical protein [Qipengyuania spongiae]|uniref:Uncharacterized protein n=1 Tax=Qipengyuania spongiae TaxID=2909673 RepID=A0ABY5SZE5_9SPHN|nr:hypothetical protein [Qipengyuania spongiae]UVI39897.1 hypothetical protein L1F33_02750 [Qipengyuania spongiae]